MRTILAGVIGAACGLTALSASATIVGSPHDLRNKLPQVDNSTGEICKVCHTPHDADANTNTGAIVPETPLWNRTLPDTAGYTMYANMSGTIDGVEDGTPTGASRLCLSCHDGTLAFDQYGGGTQDPTSLPGIPASNYAYVGQDLRGQHPVSLTYDNGADPGLHPPGRSVTIGGYDLDAADAIPALPTRTGTLGDLMLPNGKVQCSSCHDVHNTFVATSSNMLRINIAGSALCLTCHNK